MDYFFKFVLKNDRGLKFSNKEYLCEETTKGNLLYLALPSFRRIKNFYGRWYSRFSLYVHDTKNKFIYEVNGENYTLASDLSSKITGKYYLIIYASR